MNLMHTVLSFLVVIGVLVVIHELGHYLVARWCGVKVLRFSVGMGKVVWSRRFGPDQTEWAVSLLPLGGYVKMLDKRDVDAGPIAPEDARREFTAQPVGKRIAIVAAGPIANFLLAIAILAGLNMHGVPEPVARVAVADGSLAASVGLRNGDLVTAVNDRPVQTWDEMRWALLQAAMQQQPSRMSLQRASAAGGNEIAEVRLGTDAIPAEHLDNELFDRLGLKLARPPALLGNIMAGGPAAHAGLRPGDLILKVDGQPMPDAVVFVEKMQSSAGRALQLEGVRDGQPFSLIVTPQPERVGDRTVGRIQAQVDMSRATVMVAHGPLEAVGSAVSRTWDSSVLTIKMLAKLVTGQASLKNITGPITIADYAGQTAKVGWISFLSFMAFISISLGVMNLLPIPVLDGGHLLYYALELFSGRPVPERAGAILQRAGVGVLLVLMAVAMFNDIARLIG